MLVKSSVFLEFWVFGLCHFCHSSMGCILPEASFFFLQTSVCTGKNYKSYLLKVAKKFPKQGGWGELRFHIELQSVVSFALEALVIFVCGIETEHLRSMWAESYCWKRETTMGFKGFMGLRWQNGRVDWPPTPGRFSPSHLLNSEGTQNESIKS